MSLAQWFKKVFSVKKPANATIALTKPLVLTKPKFNYSPWVDELKKHIGKHEVKDKSWLSKWLKSDGKTLGDPSKLPWCGDAVVTALNLTVPNITYTKELNENPYWARNWAQFGVSASHLPYGAIVVFARNGGGHVGFVIGISSDGKYLYVLGGNQSDSVSIVPIAISRMIASRWPNEAPKSPIKLPVLKGGAVSTNES